MASGELSDSKKVGRKALEERFSRKQQLTDVGFIMSSVEGRRFLWRMLRAGRVFQSCFTGNNTSFWNEGRRDLALEFLMDTQRFPELYLQMVKENQPPDVVQRAEREAAADE